MHALITASHLLHDEHAIVLILDQLLFTNITPIICMASKLSSYDDWSFLGCLAQTISDFRQIVDQASAEMGHPSEISIALYTTHQDLCRLSDPEDSNYRVISEQLVVLSDLQTRAQSDDAPENLRTILESAVSAQLSHGFKDLMTKLAMLHPRLHLSSTSTMLVSPSGRCRYRF